MDPAKGSLMQVVTWTLIIIGWVVSYFIAIGVARKSATNSKKRQSSENALQKSEEIEEFALDYWTTGRQAPANDAALESKILSLFDRLEDYMTAADTHSKRNDEILDLIIELRRSVTEWPWQSSERKALVCRRPSSYTRQERVT